ncbi:MAG: LysR family transcriptional regulator [Liquorilactobacillus nagelii]|jgi:DNA-binding transcriptional LysR family regulator|uniref:LysR substrate-binding domain-containing protein n=1 Tax=Liquorilactobacillus nagelii TaxID=82688 RepID=UPI001CCFC9B1|nr:LysR substrate-binding domain-containing protein [Liquorilactobacillus nagelii]MCI1632659.1 LysR family transcriptional regulator [Liquorilactobacillus nagelii]MCI1921736.1 LysR family transcriptional regulator [Liquorilactobacillus nagelii]MCI1976232.1 LysR family transcriptional regulator [Liquorilactobacillus nagelii]ULQ49634.1 LysR family transcriptional regulator [Liquorilactobacillus nagelii]
MNTKDLEYFIRLTEIKSFSKVAKDFSVSQPAITFALKRLENELNAKLIIRFRAQKELIVTDSGKQLLEHARRILLNYDLVKKEIDSNRLQQLALGLPPIIENNYFPLIAKNLKNHGLLDKIRTWEYGSKTTLAALKNGEIDLALLGSIDPLSDEGIHTEEFDRQPFAIFVSRQHPLAKVKQVYFSELKNEDFVLFKDGFIHNQAFNLLVTRNHLRPRVVFRSNGTHSLMNLIAQGVGIGFLTSVISPLRDDIIKIKLLDQDLPHFVTSIAYRRSHIFTPLQQEILTEIRKSLN